MTSRAPSWIRPVALVEAYLNVNGYFTVAEYLVLEASRHGGVKTATDLDVLAFRFPGAGVPCESSKGRRSLGAVTFRPDPALGCPDDRPDMMVAEVKEGRARLNPAMRDPIVLGAALSRFGCCSPEHAGGVVERLLRLGATETHGGHSVRIVAFGATPEPERHGNIHVVPMQQVLRFLRAFLRDNWHALRRAAHQPPGSRPARLAREGWRSTPVTHASQVPRDECARDFNCGS